MRELSTHPEFTGRRRHPQDLTNRHYTFSEWVSYADSEWVGKSVSFPEAAMVLAKHAWQTVLVPEEKEEDDVPMNALDSDEDALIKEEGWNWVMRAP